MKMSEKETSVIYQKYLKDNNLKDNLINKTKFRMFLRTMKKYEDRFVGALNNSGVEVSTNDSPGLNVSELYKILIEIYGRYDEKGLDDFFASSPNNKFHEMMDSFSNKYDANFFENQSGELSPLEQAYYASKLDVNYADISLKLFNEDRKDYFASFFLREFKNIDAKTIDKLINENLEELFDLDTFNRSIYKNVENYDKYQQIMADPNNKFYKALRLQTIKTITKFISEEELLYLQKNDSYMPKTTAKLKLGLVPDLVERIYTSNMTQNQGDVIRGLIQNSETLSKSWTMDDTAKYLNIIWNYRDLINKYDSPSLSEERIELAKRIDQICSMPIEQIVAGGQDIQEEISDISLSFEALQREDLVSRLNEVETEEKPNEIMTDNGETITINSTYIDSPEKVGVFLASFISPDRFADLEAFRKSRTIKDTEIVPFTEDDLPIQEHHYCATAFTAKAAALGGTRGNVFFIYDGKHTDPENIIINQARHNPTKNDLYDIFSTKNNEIISPMKDIVETQMRGKSGLFNNTYEESEADIDIMTTPAAVGILYSKKAKQNGQKEELEQVVEYAKKHNLPIMIYDMEEIASKLEQSKVQPKEQNKHNNLEI